MDSLKLVFPKLEFSRYEHPYTVIFLIPQEYDLYVELRKEVDELLPVYGDAEIIKKLDPSPQEIFYTINTREKIESLSLGDKARSIEEYFKACKKGFFVSIYCKGKLSNRAFQADRGGFPERIPLNESACLIIKRRRDNSFIIMFDCDSGINHYSLIGLNLICKNSFYTKFSEKQINKVYVIISEEQATQISEISIEERVLMLAWESPIYLRVAAVLLFIFTIIFYYTNTHTREIRHESKILQQSEKEKSILDQKESKGIRKLEK